MTFLALLIISHSWALDSLAVPKDALLGFHIGIFILEVVQSPWNIYTGGLPVGIFILEGFQSRWNIYTGGLPVTLWNIYTGGLPVIS